MSNKSSFSGNSLKRNRDKVADSIPCRIDFIKNLLHGKSIKPLVNFDNTDTECFFNINDKDESESRGSLDTRVVLQKRFGNFTKIIMQIGYDREDQLEYIKSGTSGHTFHGKVTDENGDPVEYGVKVVAYPKKEKYGNMYDIRRPENAELNMIKVLSYFVVKRQTPHIVLPVGTFDTDIEEFTCPELLDVVGKKNSKYNEFLKKYKRGDYYDKVSILISEWANRGDLLDFLRKFYNDKKFTANHWKSIFFQFLSVLAVIQSKFPDFRHNDLKANNILVHKIVKPEENFTYRIAKKKYKVRNIGYQIKLWDFDFACIPGVVDNIKVELEWTKAINVTPEKNRYYDVHYFFNTLIKKGFCGGIMTSKKVPQEVKDFINRVLPEKYQNDPKSYELRDYIENMLPKKYSDEDYGSSYINGYKIPSSVRKFIESNLPEKYKNVRTGLVHEKGRLLANDEYLTPLQILENDPYFEEYRVKDDNETNIKKISKQQKVITGTPDFSKLVGGCEKNRQPTMHYVDPEGNIDRDMPAKKKNKRPSTQKKIRKNSKKKMQGVKIKKEKARTISEEINKMGPDYVLRD
jgi:hypothetical protein